MTGPVYTVWEAVEDGGFLPVGESVILEVLDHDMDGVFPNLKSWKAFVTGNFLNSGWFVSEVKHTTLKKYCRDLSEYSSLFRVKVGTDKWLKVNSDDLDFTFDYGHYYSRLKIEGLKDFPSMIQITVKASIK